VKKVNTELDLYPLQKLSAWQLAYIAGILDGEGCIMLNSTKQGYVISTVTVSMANASCMRLLHSITGVGTLRATHRKGYTRTYYVWQASDRLEVYMLLKAIYPYLVVKRAEAESVMEFIERRMDNIPLSSHDLILQEKVKSLKREGIEEVVKKMPKQQNLRF
jgi:hypothetical protein